MTQKNCTQPPKNFPLALWDWSVQWAKLTGSLRIVKLTEWIADCCFPRSYLDHKQNDSGKLAPAIRGKAYTETWSCSNMMIEHDSSVRMIILVNTSQLLHFKNLFDPWASWDSGQQQINPCSDRPRRCFNMSWHSLRFTERPWCSCWAIQLFPKPDQNVVLFWWFWNLSEVTLLIFLLAIWNETFRVCKYEVFQLL